MAKNDTDPKLQPFLDEYKKRIDKMPHGLERSIESALFVRVRRERPRPTDS